MHTLDEPQIRVLGCLLEKQQTTPDSYPLTLNALRTACNQATSRDPVVDYDEATVREAAQKLGRRGWARLASYHGSRTTKYRQTFDEALGLAPDERALLCVLMLRGPQTVGELKQRTDRMHPFPDLGSVEQALDRLTERELGRWLERRPGQKEARYTHLLGEDGDAPAAGAVPAEVAPAPDPVAAEPPDEPAEVLTNGVATTDLAEEVAQLRRELQALREDVAALRDELGS
jgi:uncharacterized protein YceH (UPF0502 family)